MSEFRVELPHNVDVWCAEYSAGNVDWDQLIDYVHWEVGNQLDDTKKLLAKRLAKATKLDWQTIQIVTDLNHAVCRQAVIDARYPPASRSIRKKVLARDGHRCRNCGSARHVVVDHVVPRALGGRNTMANLQALCTRCNIRKGSRLV